MHSGKTFFMKDICNANELKEGIFEDRITIIIFSKIIIILPTFWMQFTSKVIVIHIYTPHPTQKHTHTHTIQNQTGVSGSKFKNEPHFLWPVTSKSLSYSDLSSELLKRLQS